MTTGFKKLAKAYAWLGKFSISLPVALTTFTGYLLAYRGFSYEVLFPVAGVFLLASGASALNQVQEYKIDLLMPRTRNRPIPSGRISLTGAWIFIFIFSLSGLALLFFYSGYIAGILGLLNIFWYNGIYTPLKRTTAFAVVPGSIVGALPPLIGWVAAGGSLLDSASIALGFFFFIGQIPHFWLLLLRFGKEYEMAGLKSLTTHFNNVQIRRLTFVWIAATAVVAFMLPGFYRFNHTAIIYILWILSVFLVIIFIGLIKPSKEDVEFRTSFIRINIYYFYVMVLLCLDVLL